MISLSDKFIYIVGPMELQNALMTSHLERETGVRCEALKGLRDLPASADEETGHMTLLLWDCQGKTLDNLLAELESDGKEVFPRYSVAFFNVAPGMGIEEEAVRQGVRGIFYEQTPLDSFLKGVKTIFTGELWLSRQIMTDCILKFKRQDSFSRRDETGLTHREIEILAMVAEGATNEKIADDLCISPHTVKTHIYNIFKKIEVPNRLQAALWAVKNL